MDVLEHMAPNLTLVLRRNAWWMTWNLLLAWIPVGLGVLLFWRPDDRRRSLWWCMGLGSFGLFLPNAPYVVTDLIHLRQDVVMVGHEWPVITAVLPVYGSFIGAGFLAYYLSLALLGGYLDRLGWGRWRGSTFVALHAVCAVGVYLGRHIRLNSWEPVVQPRDTLERVVLGLSWRWAPFFIAATFLVTWAGHFVTKAVVEAAWQTVVRWTRSLRGWAAEG
jgi:uncharacterized membrane protein